MGGHDLTLLDALGSAGELYWRTWGSLDSTADEKWQRPRALFVVLSRRPKQEVAAPAPMYARGKLTGQKDQG